LLVHALSDTPCSRCQIPFGAAIGLRRKVGQRRFHPPRPRPALGAQEARFIDIFAGFPHFWGRPDFFGGFHLSVEAGQLAANYISRDWEALALAGIGIAAAAWVRRRRRS
jgi:hypothetical protein